MPPTPLHAPYCEISNRNITQTGAIMGSCPRPTHHPEHIEGIWGGKLWLEICYSRCEGRTQQSRQQTLCLQKFSSSLVLYVLSSSQPRFDSYWTAGGARAGHQPLYLRPFIFFNLNNHHFSPAQRNYSRKYGFHLDFAIKEPNEVKCRKDIAHKVSIHLKTYHIYLLKSGYQAFNGRRIKKYKNKTLV